MNYEPVIGIEVHVELLTRSKMFCSCSAEFFGAEPNTLTCPVCTGMPGTLPVINRRAVEYTIMTGLALHCHINEISVFSRKNYFYPDLPKSYQISMYDFPLCEEGWLEIEVNDQLRRIRVRRVHLEEDTAKLFHVGNHALVDFNRSGVPLMEIVSEPDIRSPEEARQYLVKLRTILRYLGVSTADMEKGAMRCEANVSLRPVGSAEMGTKVEVKNLNSFRAVKLALEYEIRRQQEILEQGGSIEQVTMGWDEQRGVTVVQRTKEYAHDYRYFPEPDLPPLEISREWVEEIRSRLPELPDAKRDRFMRQYGLSRYDASVLVADRTIADFYESCVAVYPQAKKVANWITGELFRLMNETGTPVEAVKVTPSALAELLALVDDKTINISTAKVVFEEMFATGRGAKEIVEARGLAQIRDAAALAQVVDQVIAANPDQVAQYRGGKETLLRWFIGQVMRATRGKANPQLVEKLLRERL